MERIETEAMIDQHTQQAASLDSAVICDSLTQLESYYQSKYEYYLAMATEAKENKERVGLLLLDLGRDVSYPDNLVESKRTSHGCAFDAQPVSSSIDRRLHNGSASHRSSDNERIIQELPQADPEPEPSPPASSVVDEEKEASSSVEQMKKWTLDLIKAMSVIESVSNSDSGKALHQNYLHHLLQRELGQKLAFELVELYLEEATRRGYLEPDEFNNNCYIAKAKDDSGSEAFGEPNENIATEKATTEILSGRKSKDVRSAASADPCIVRNKPYDLPPSDQLKPTLYETVEGYIKKNRPKRFSINDVINYLYPQPIQLDWDKALKNQVRTSISNVLSRKAYLGKHWSRIKPGVYRPRV